MSKSTEKYRQKERHQHKQEREQAILKIAREAFLHQGYAKTSMAGIANQAHISRKTLYQYFSSKEAIAFDIEIQVFEDFLQLQEKALTGLSGTGYQQVTGYFDFLIATLNQWDDFIRLTGLFDSYFIDDYPAHTKDKRFASLIEETTRPLVTMIKSGIADGSIRPDVEAEAIAHTISNAFLALAQRVISREKNLTKEHHMPPRKMIDIQGNLFLHALKNTH